MPRRLRTEARNTLRETFRLRRKYTRNARYTVTFTLQKNILRVDVLANLTLPNKQVYLRAYKLIELRQKRRIKTYELTRRFRNLAITTPYYDTAFPTQHRRILKAKSLVLLRIRKVIESKIKRTLRAELAYRPYLDILQNYINKIRAIDQAILTLDPTVREELLNALINIARGNKLTRLQVASQPLLRYLSQRYILFYQEHPFTRNIYALRLTPLLMAKSREQNQTYYVMKVLEATTMKMSALAGLVKRLAFQIYRYLSKRGGEWVNSLSYSSYAEGTRSDSIVLARDDMQQPIFTRPLYDVVFRPHEIKKATVKMLGTREIYDEVRNPSVYSMIQRRTRVSKLYDHNAPSLLLMGKQRRRFKEIIAKKII